MDIIKLSSICDLQNGFAFKSNDYVEYSETLSCRMSNIRPGGFFDLDYNSRYLPDSYYNKYKSYALKDGDLVIAMTDLANDPKILGVPTIVKTGGRNLLLNQRVGKLVIKEPEKVHIPYLQYALNRPENKNYYRKFAGGGLQINVGKKEVLNNEIPLPPLKTQQKIAAILDEADKLRRLNKKLVKKYEQLSQSLFLERFNSLKGKKVNLDELCEINPRKSEISDVEKSTMVSFIPMANVSERGEVQLEEFRALREVWDGFTYFQEDDVLFAKITPCMENGKGAIMRNLLNSIGFGSTEFHVLRPIKGLSTSEWLYYLTSSKEFRKIAEQNMTGSAGQKRVPTYFFSSFEIAPPPFGLQKEFAEKVKQIEKQKTQAQKGLEHSEKLFNSLLQRAFKGELVKE